MNVPERSDAPGTEPRLASWMAAGHPDQLRLDEFLTHAYELVKGQLERAPEPLVLGLDVGLHESISLEHLWKATIDALDPILGRTIPQHPWHPRDGRIAELGLHCGIEPSLKNDVMISIDASAKT